MRGVRWRRVWGQQRRRQASCITTFLVHSLPSYFRQSSNTIEGSVNNSLIDDWSASDQLNSAKWLSDKSKLQSNLVPFHSQYGLLILLLALTLSVGSCRGARRLRKKPKVYNALITTDDNLTSSRAYPVIQPTIHEPGYAPFGPYNPFGFYSPPLVRFGQPLVPGLPPNERVS